MTAKKRAIATMKNPTIEAIVNGLFEFESVEQVKNRLDTVAENFITSKEQPEDQPALRLWIRGFQITSEEKKQGYLGNYAIMRPIKQAENLYTLFAAKEETELDHHPQKKRPKTKHPNWGHPVLRRVQKGHVFNNIEEVRGELQKLHRDYPETTIPCTNKCYVMIYQKPENPGEKPVQKYVLHIDVLDSGGFVIRPEKNTYERPAEQAEQEEGRMEATKQEVQGYFTSKVQISKKV